MEKSILDKQNIIARKYTVMMNKEPLDLWIKGDKITKAAFMDRKADLSLSPETVQHIKSMPTRLVNGENLREKEDFVRKTSALMSAQLELAIARQDMKILSRFAQSQLVPEAQKEDFLQAVNRPRGLRGAITKGLNHAQKTLRAMAQRIDRFFDRTKDAIANEKLDSYLKEFQHTEFNKVPKYTELDLSKHVDPKLQEKAYAHVKERGQECFYEDSQAQKQAQEEFLRSAVRDGYSATDAKLALGHCRKDLRMERGIEERNFDNQNLQMQLDNISEKYLALDYARAREQNKTEQDLKAIMSDLQQQHKDPSELIPFIVENEAYKAASAEEKWNIENRVLYGVEPVQNRAEENKAIAEALLASKDNNQTREVERGWKSYDDPDKYKSLLARDFKKQQEAIKPENNPTQETYTKYHNLAAVKFNGIDKNALESWAHNAQKRGVSKERTNDFIQRSLKHGETLAQAGIMRKEAEGVYKFVDPAARASLWKNHDKPLAQLGELNKQQSNGNSRIVNPKHELIERVKMISSAQSFEQLLDKQGNIQPEKLREYAEVLEKASLQLRAEANQTVITREDLQQVKEHYRGHAQTQDYGQERA